MAGLSKKAKKTREQGVGSSEISMLVYRENEQGELKPVSRFGGRHKLWRQKTGREPETKTKRYMERGNYIEPALLKWYSDEHGVSVKKPPTIVHPKYPYAVDSADGLTYPKGKAGKVRPLRCLEVKAPHWTMLHHFGTQGTDEVEESYLLQSMWHIEHHRPEEMICDVPVDTGGDRLDYTVNYDEELALALISIAEKFWMDHVEPDIEPGYDDFDDANRWLSKYLRHKKDAGLLDATDEQVKLMLDFRAKALDIKAREGELAEIQNKIMLEIGEYDGLIVPGSKQKITWKRSKNQTRIDWKAVANELAKEVDPKAFAALQDANSSVSLGSRKFTPTSLLNHEE